VRRSAVAIRGRDFAALLTVPRRDFGWELRARIEVVLAYRAADLLGVDDIAAVTHLGVDPVVAMFRAL
jgi:hypothetical protein